MGFSQIYNRLKQNIDNRGSSISTKTNQEYRKACKEFAAYCISKGYKKWKKIQASNLTELVQSYEQELENRNYSPYSIQVKIAGICSGLNNQISLSQIKHPHRSTPKKGRNPSKNSRGKSEASSEKFHRLVAFAKAVGIRRSEYAHLKGSDIGRDSDGYLYIYVKSGKGGKSQRQRILPQNEAIVLETFQNINPGDSVFSHIEMTNSIDLHAYRRENARSSYKYYCHKLKSNPAYADILKKELISYYYSMQSPKFLSTSKGKSHEKRFLAELNRNSRYFCRNEQLVRCKDAGIDNGFDRLAAMATSVFHLSHWRIGVAVKNYLL